MKKSLSLLKGNNQVFLENDINIFFESYIKISKLYYELEKFNINEGFENEINLDIIHKNIINDFKYNNLFGYNILNINNNNNKYLNINNLINYYKMYKLNDISLDNYIKIFGKQFSYDFDKSNLINSQNPKEIQYNPENNDCSLELKKNMEEFNGCKKIKNKKRKYNMKKNIFKVITKISKFKGVTRNKKNWQAYIRINNKNTYLGSYKSEIIAAKIYDLMAIKKKGIKARTNFKYNNQQIKKIINLELNIHNLFEIANNGTI